MAAIAAPGVQATGRPAIPDIVKLVDAGRFNEADAQISLALAEQRMPLARRKAVLLERERMRRIRLDFPHRRGQLMEHVRKQIPDLRAAEFDQWDRAGLLERIVIDGEAFYFDRAASNLFWLSQEALARRDASIPPLGAGPLETPHPHHAEVRQAALETRSTSVAPRRVRVDYSVTVKADAVPAGKLLRAWLPYPRVLPGQQENLRLIETLPDSHRVAPESAMQRTVFLEQVARAGKPTRFSVSYELTVFAQYHALHAERIEPVTPTPELRPYLEERPPHIVFTPALRDFSRKVVGAERNPYRVAKLLFDAVDRVPWAGAREYSTISNLSNHVLEAGYGDCGQQTMLLIALLRLNGIPARWQSGWVFSNGDYDTMHDWGQLYLAPHGWVPVDVTYGRLPTPDGKDDYFYLGGLDAYRVVFNDDYSREFVPPKQHFRSETVDSQRGEVEWEGGNVYFDQWGYDFKWRLLPENLRRADVAKP